MLDYFIQVEEADELAKLTKQPPSYPPAPRLLVLYNRLNRWDTLPVAGGYMDQPAYLMLALDVVADAVAERRKIEQINLRLQQQEEATTTTGGMQGLPQSKE